MLKILVWLLLVVGISIPCIFSMFSIWAAWGTPTQANRELVADPILHQHFFGLRLLGSEIIIRPSIVAALLIAAGILLIGTGTWLFLHGSSLFDSIVFGDDS